MAHGVVCVYLRTLSAIVQFDNVHSWNFSAPLLCGLGICYIRVMVSMHFL